MCAALSLSAFQLRTKILSEAAKHVRAKGFTNAALRAALMSMNEKGLNDSAIAHLFSRGFPVALVEYVVKSSNAAVQRELESSFNKNAMTKSIETNMANFVQDRLMLPTAGDVAEKAILAKLDLLKPLAQHWPHAVALEYMPSNVPYTIINLAEFADTTAYYMERVAAFNELLEPARRILQSKAMASRIQVNGSQSSSEAAPATSSFLTSFLQGIPLSSGPHAGHSGVNPSWFCNRTKLLILYGTVTTSFLGDVSRNGVDTRQLTRKAVRTLF